MRGEAHVGGWGLDSRSRSALGLGGPGLTLFPVGLGLVQLHPLGHSLIYMPLKDKTESQILKQRPNLKYSLPLSTGLSLFSGLTLGCTSSSWLNEWGDWLEAVAGLG